MKKLLLLALLVACDTSKDASKYTTDTVNAVPDSGRDTTVSFDNPHNAPAPSRGTIDTSGPLRLGTRSSSSATTSPDSIKYRFRITLNRTLRPTDTVAFSMGRDTPTSAQYGTHKTRGTIDSFTVKRVPDGTNAKYWMCAELINVATSRRCATWIYFKAVPPPPVDTTPPKIDSLIVDSSVARIMVTPKNVIMASATPACKALAPNYWADINQLTLKPDCYGYDSVGHKLPMVIKYCAYALLRNGTWILTSNSMNEPRCKNELPSVQKGTVIGMFFAPGEPLRVGTGARS